MPIVATIMNSTTGQPIQKMSFGRMPKPWASLNLEIGELVKADREDVGKPAPGKVVVPVSVWVTPKEQIQRVAAALQYYRPLSADLGRQCGTGLGGRVAAPKRPKSGRSAAPTIVPKATVVRQRVGVSRW